MNETLIAPPIPTSQEKTPEMHPTKIEVSNLDFFYGSNHALKGVTVKIQEREITALIGPSGCGKSTFLRCMNRMNDLIAGTRATGTILLDGEEILGPEADVVQIRQRVGMVFQRPNPFPMSIFDNIAYGPRCHGNPSRAFLEELAQRCLTDAALWDEVKDKLHQSAMALSGGQQQRLCIARALAVEPEVLLMDEPCSALDPISTLRIEELMQDLKQSYTIVIVTHNMQQAARVSSMTGVFLHGEMIEYDTSNVIFTRPKDKRTEDYVTGRFG